MFWSTACGAGGDAGAPSLRADAGAPAGDTISVEERAEIQGFITFVSERDGRPQVYTLSPTGEGERQLRESDADEYPTVPAPDGSALIIVQVVQDALAHLEQLWLQPLPSGEAVPIGPRSARARNPSWSPDGRWIVFESDIHSFRDLYRIDRDGQNLTRLTDDPEGNFEPTVSPDGESIVFASSRDGNAEVYRMRADGGAQVRLTHFHRDDWAPRWSPDGNAIAFLSNREGDDRIFLMAPDGTGQRRLGQAAATLVRREGGEGPRFTEEEPAWSPDGRRIAFTVREMDRPARIWVVDLETGDRAALTDGTANDVMPAWSPDGRYIAFASDRDGDLELYLMRADGSAATRLTHSQGPDWLPRWIPPTS